MIEAVAAGLDRHGVTQVVLDPVMVATSGDRLLKADAVDRLSRLLLPRAHLITPNLPEAAALLDDAGRRRRRPPCASRASVCSSWARGRF